MIIGSRTLPNAERTVVFRVVFPDSTGEEETDTAEWSRKETEEGILREMTWEKKCRRAFVDWFSDDEEA